MDHLLEFEAMRRDPARFNQVAEGYDRPTLRAFVTSAQRLVELAAPKPGEIILDVATGTGNAAIVAAHLVGATGKVMAVDAAGAMRERARQKIRALSLSNVEVLEGDAAALNFPNNYFAAVICASAIYTLADIPASLREWRRVLQPGGRVAFSALGVGTYRLYDELLFKYGVPLLPVGPLQRTDTPEKCAVLLHDAGFVEIAAHTEQFGYYLEDAEQCWDIIWHTGARTPLNYLSPAALESFKAEYLAAMRATATTHGIWMDWPVVFALGRKPANA
jgi:ubiquinone/menaquinone biosynthesis C-methylase UbiE